MSSSRLASIGGCPRATSELISSSSSSPGALPLQNGDEHLRSWLIYPRDELTSTERLEQFIGKSDLLNLFRVGQCSHSTGRVGREAQSDTHEESTSTNGMTSAGFLLPQDTRKASDAISAEISLVVTSQCGIIVWCIALYMTIQPSLASAAAASATLSCLTKIQSVSLRDEDG
jgi:hypothetical protein